MLDSLEIRNYRTLKELRIPSLGKVNLITGKNNTGKSTILEAIAIYASKGDTPLIYDLLSERGENFKKNDVNKNATELNIRALSSLFTDRVVQFGKEGIISIGSVASNLFGEEISLQKRISLRFVKYVDETERDTEGNVFSRRRIVLENEIDKQHISYNLGLELRVGKASFILSLDKDRPYRFGMISSAEKFEFIRPRNIDRVINGTLWDNITLSEKEKYVIEALKIIEPSTERIAFIEENSRERTAVIKLSNSANVVPLRSMGDGINRILTIILALVNSDNGFLLIDEFENGLHYTVQDQLWNVVFNLARSLNVQVFVTTHSEDCIRSFESILNDPANSSDGKLIRLNNVNGVIKQVEFDAHELKIANDQNIEIR